MLIFLTVHKYFCLFSAVLLPIFELQLPIFNSVSAHFQQFHCLFIFNRYFYFLIAFMPIVRYHCGGWPEEVNACFLNPYMVYL